MPRFAANLSMMFGEMPFLDRFAAARAAGFTAVEFLFPYEHPIETVAQRARQAAPISLASSRPVSASRPASAALRPLSAASRPIATMAGAAAIASTQPRLPQRHRGPSGSTQICPTSPAEPLAPR